MLEAKKLGELLTMACRTAVQKEQGLVYERLSRLSERLRSSQVFFKAWRKQMALQGPRREVLSFSAPPGASEVVPPKRVRFEEQQESADEPGKQAKAVATVLETSEGLVDAHRHLLLSHRQVSALSHHRASPVVRLRVFLSMLLTRNQVLRQKFIAIVEVCPAFFDDYCPIQKPQQPDPYRDLVAEQQGLKEEQLAIFRVQTSAATRLQFASRVFLLRRKNIAKKVQRAWRKFLVTTLRPKRREMAKSRERDRRHAEIGEVIFHHDVVVEGHRAERRLIAAQNIAAERRLRRGRGVLTDGQAFHPAERMNFDLMTDGQLDILRGPPRKDRIGGRLPGDADIEIVDVVSTKALEELENEICAEKLENIRRGVGLNVAEIVLAAGRNYVEERDEREAAAVVVFPSQEEVGEVVVVEEVVEEVVEKAEVGAEEVLEVESVSVEQEDGGVVEAEPPEEDEPPEEEQQPEEDQPPEEDEPPEEEEGVKTGIFSLVVGKFAAPAVVEREPVVVATQQEAAEPIALDPDLVLQDQAASPSEIRRGKDRDRSRERRARAPEREEPLCERELGRDGLSTSDRFLSSQSGQECPAGCTTVHVVTV